ncbi:MAS20-domain-containing protein, partial [Panus rudis PR-1116 ss-1]
MSSRATTIWTITGVTVLGGIIAYAIYFDHKRRNDVEFRKKLKKEKKKANKSAAKQTEANTISTDELRAALSKIQQEDLPAGPEEREQYFMTQVGMGEQLAAQGPAFQLPAALSFYRALRVYPSPVELVMIYQKTVPPSIFKIIMDLTNMDVKNRVEGYYNVFPPKSMNVSVQDSEVPGNATKKKVLVAEKDFAAGDVIYKEEPIVAALDFDLLGKGTHCSRCFREIQKDMAIKPEFDRFDSVYCSKECQVKAKAQSDNLLFGLDPVLPPELDGGVSELTKAERNKTQTAFVDYLQSKGKTGPLLVSRFVARQVAIETTKLLPKTAGPASVELPKLTDGNDDYGLYDHMERLRFIDVPVEPEETKLLCDVLAAALPGLEKSLTDERNAVYRGKMAYNAYGVCFGGGRDDRPIMSDRPEDQERTRTPYGTSRQIGSGLYFVSSYISHSCSPNSRPSFSSGTSELQLIASRPIKKGEELTVAYVDVNQHEGETAEEARRRRRYELARGWRFKCECERCVSEQKTDGNESDVEVQKDESKVEGSVERLEKGEYPTPPQASSANTGDVDD